MGIKHVRKRVLGICVAVCLAMGLAGIAYAQTQGADGDSGAAAADDEVTAVTVQSSPFVEGGIRSTGVDADRTQTLGDGTLAISHSDEKDMPTASTTATNGLSASADTDVVVPAPLDDDEDESGGGDGDDDATLQVSLTWVDDDNRDGARPDSVVVQIFANGKNIGEVTLSDENEWTAEFTDPNEYEDGEVIDYTASVQGVDEVDYGFEYEVNEDDQGNKYIEIVGKHVIMTSDIVVTKSWDDADNNDNKRTNSVTVYLLADGEQDEMITLRPGRSGVTVSDDGNTWEYTFADKPAVYQDGEEIVYTLEEDPVPDYETTVVTVRGDEVEKDGVTYQPYSFNVTNTHEPEEAAIEGSKTWDDDNNNDNRRPDEITIRLLADGDEVDSKTVTEADDWSWNFEGWPKYVEGTEIKYTITEDAVEDYSATYDGFDVTNSYTPGTTNVTVTAFWEDNDNKDGNRPKYIEVELLADGEPTEDLPLMLNELNGWTNTFSKLPVYASGEKIEYTVVISDIDGGEGYKFDDISGDMETGFVITSTYELATIDLAGTVTWNDDDNANNTRPESVMIHVLADGEEVDSVTVTADDDWTWSLEGLPRYADGAEIEYTITQDAVPGYTTEVDGYNVANTYAANDAGSGTGGSDDGTGTGTAGSTETGTADSTGTSTTGSTGTGSTGGTGGTSTGSPVGSTGTGTTGTGSTGTGTGGTSTPTGGTGSTTSTATTPSSGTAASNPASGSSSPAANSSAIPQTGDTTPTAAWIVLALIALTTAALAVVQMRRYRHRDKYVS